MSGFGKILITVIISFFAMIGALGANNPWPCFIVAWGVWGIYLFPIFTKKRLIRDNSKNINMKEKELFNLIEKMSKKDL